MRDMIRATDWEKLGLPREVALRIARALDASAALIQRSQTAEGGWFYQPTAGVDHENSVTVVELQALRRDAVLRERLLDQRAQELVPQLPCRQVDGVADGAAQEQAGHEVQPPEDAARVVTVPHRAVAGEPDAPRAGAVKEIKVTLGGCGG